MNILFLAHPGSVHDLSWMTSLASRSGIRCFCVARKADKRFLKPGFISDLGEKKITFCGFIPDFSIVRPWQTIKGFSILSKVINKHQIDLFHILYAEPNALWVWRKKSLGIPVVITTRGSDILITIQNTFKSGSVLNNILKKLYTSAFLNADFITCTSRLQMEMISRLTKRNDKMELIRTGVDIESIRFADKNKMPDILKNKKYIFFPRNMRPVYNHEFALEAISKLPDSLKKEYAFVFLDSDSTNREYVGKIKNKLSHLKDFYFIFLPSLTKEEVFALYTKAAMVVMTPMSDGSPVSAMEAMASRCPVVMPDLNYDNVLFNPETVFFYKKNDVSSLVNSIMNILDDKITTKTITANAYKTILENGDIEKEMKRFQDIITKLKT